MGYKLRKYHHAVTTGLMKIEERHWCAKLSRQNIVEIRELFSKGVKPAQIADKFKIDRSVIYKILHKKIWKSV